MSLWYEELREQHRPDHVRILFVGESPPDPGASRRRFFYSPTLTRHDNLYRAVALALYGEDDALDLADKAEVLRRLRDDGVWLIDVTDQQVNKLNSRARTAALRESVPAFVARVVELHPALGVVVCKAPLYALVQPPLAAAGVPVLHAEPIPFPLGNHRARFVEQVRAALTQ